jgi:hypothetical protein
MFIYEFWVQSTSESTSSPVDHLPIKHYVRDKPDAVGEICVKLGGRRLSGDQRHIKSNIAFSRCYPPQPIHLIVPTAVEWWASLWVCVVGMNSESFDDL